MRPCFRDGAFVCLLRIALAQDSTITTIRPSVTNSPLTVPRAMVQFENGTLVTADQRRRTVDFPETLVRIGVLSSTEFRIMIPNYFWRAMTPQGIRSGVSGLQIGLKQKLYDGQA